MHSLIPSISEFLGVLSFGTVILFMMKNRYKASNYQAGLTR